MYEKPTQRMIKTKKLPARLGSRSGALFAVGLQKDLLAVEEAHQLGCDVGADLFVLSQVAAVGVAVRVEACVRAAVRQRALVHLVAVEVVVDLVHERRPAQVGHCQHVAQAVSVDAPERVAAVYA